MIAESRCAPKDPLLFFFLGGANLDRRFRYAFTGAKVEYRASEESEEVQVATTWTSAPGLIEVMSYEEFARNNSPHLALRRVDRLPRALHDPARHPVHDVHQLGRLLKSAYSGKRQKTARLHFVRVL